MPATESAHSSTGSRVFLYTTGFLIMTAIAYEVLDIIDHEVIGHISAADDHSESSNVVSIGNHLLSHFNNFDPEDPDDFRKVVKLVIAAGLSAATLAKMYGMNEGTVRRWGNGTMLPAPIARRSIFDSIKTWLESNN